MGDDNLFPAGEAAEGSEAKPTPEAPNIEELVTKAAREAVGEAVQPLAPALDQIATFMEQANAGINAARSEEAAAPGADPNAAFFNDPTAATKEAATAAAKEVVAPLVQALGNSATTASYNTAKADFDGKHGDGTFDENITPTLRRALENMSPEQRADGNHVTGVISTLIGLPQVSDKLFELRKAHEAKQAAAAAEESPGMLTGGARRGRSDEGLTNDAKELLASWNSEVEEGYQISESDYVKYRGLIDDASTDESRWKPVFAQEGS